MKKNGNNDFKKCSLCTESLCICRNNQEIKQEKPDVSVCELPESL